MHLKHLEIKGFRNYREGSVTLGPGVSIIVGSNGAGKTSFLEAAQYYLCGRSFRTSRESEMVREGSGLLRLGATLERDGVERRRYVSLEPGSPAHVDQGGGSRWEEPGCVLCFSPDDLQLVKGAPAERRRFLNEAIALRQPAFGKLSRDYRKVLSQRNRFLQRARAGAVRLADISPWDRQLMTLAMQIYHARREYCLAIEPAFTDACRRISGSDAATGITYISQMERFADEEEAEAAATRELEQHWNSDMERGTTGIGTHRDDVELMLDGKSVRTYGSQGEQRSAVLALLLAEASGDGGRRPLLLLDDVLSELDPDRRGRLLAMLGNGLGGQVLITAADHGLVPPSGCADAAILTIGPGARIVEREGSRV